MEILLYNKLIEQKLVLMIGIIVDVPIQQVMAKVELQNVHEKSVQSDEIYRPITFPQSEEDRDIVAQRLSSSFPMPLPSFAPTTANLNTLPADQKFSSPSIELERPTRVAIAATSNSDAPTTQFADEQLDYVRDFSWNMFQV